MRRARTQNMIGREPWPQSMSVQLIGRWRNICVGRALRRQGAHHRRQRRRQGSRGAADSSRAAGAATRRWSPSTAPAMPDTLLESELFGHVRGSFTDAYRDKRGLLEAANGGTVFIDEVGEMSLRMQALLLRFLETGEIQRVGDERNRANVNVRVIAATNRRLPERIASGDVPRGPVLPSERDSHHDSAAARTARRHGAAARALPAAVRRRARRAAAGHRRRRRRRARGLRLAGQRARTAEHRRAAHAAAARAA